MLININQCMQLWWIDDAFAVIIVIDYHFKSENSGLWNMEDASKVSNKMNLTKW